MGYVVNWQEDDLWNLLNLPNRELYRLYAGLYSGTKRDRQMNIRSKANSFKRKLNQGRITMPERLTPYDPDKEPGRIESRRQAAALHLGGKSLETTVLSIPTEHVPYHEKLQAALQSEGALSSARFSDYEMGYKDKEGEAQTHPLHASRFEVKFNAEPEWVPVNRVESVRLPRRERKEADALRTSKRAVILSDTQIPYMDEKAMQVALDILRDVKPDKVIMVGDLLDLAAWSKYIQRPEWALQTQAAINRAHLLLQQIRKLAPTAEITVLEGNHDARMEKYALNNAQAAFGLKRADQPEGWPVLSVPYLTAMDTLDINYVAGYPANRTWINQNLQVRHGNIARKGHTASAVAEEEGISTIFGHIHRVETQMRTRQTYEGGKTIGAWSIGCLCDIMGSVPSVKGGVDLSGRPVPNAENWQAGLAVVDFEEGDGAYNVQPIYINTFANYQAIVNGKKYESREV